MVSSPLKANHKYVTTLHTMGTGSVQTPHTNTHQRRGHCVLPESEKSNKSEHIIVANRGNWAPFGGGGGGGLHCAAFFTCIPLSGQTGLQQVQSHRGPEQGAGLQYQGSRLQALQYIHNAHPVLVHSLGSVSGSCVSEQKDKGGGGGGGRRMRRNSQELLCRLAAASKTRQNVLPTDACRSTAAKRARNTGRSLRGGVFRYTVFPKKPAFSGVPKKGGQTWPTWGQWKKAPGGGP